MHLTDFIFTIDMRNNYVDKSATEYQSLTALKSNKSLRSLSGSESTDDAGGGTKLYRTTTHLMKQLSATHLMKQHLAYHQRKSMS